ncbi:MAG TPA: NAD(P)H-dependent oxidoreductase [Candidatus Paceibacterota bacterium]
MSKTNDKSLYIPVVLGTAREGRQSIKVARFVHAEFLKRAGIETELIDVKDFIFPRTVPSWEDYEIAKRWREIAEHADGFIIIVPEYNRGYPGELKQLLDSAYNEYEKKPVGLVGVSDGRFGGTAAISNITPTLVELGLVVLRGAVRISNVDKQFNDKDEPVELETYKKLVSKLFDSVISYALILKSDRVKA